MQTACTHQNWNAVRNRKHRTCRSPLAVIENTDVNAHSTPADIHCLTVGRAPPSHRYTALQTNVSRKAAVVKKPFVLKKQYRITINPSSSATHTNTPSCFLISGLGASHLSCGIAAGIVITFSFSIILNLFLIYN